MSGEVRLHPDDREAIARRVVELLREDDRRGGDDHGMVDPATLAEHLGVGRDFVYSHAPELGGVKLGDGPRGRWRFDPAVAAERLGGVVEKAAPAPRRRQPATRQGRDLLPIRGEGR